MSPALNRACEILIGLRVAVGDVVRELPFRLLAHRLREGGAHTVGDLAQRVLGQQTAPRHALLGRADAGAALHPDVDDLADADDLDRLVREARWSGGAFCGFASPSSRLPTP